MLISELELRQSVLLQKQFNKIVSAWDLFPAKEFIESENLERSLERKRFSRLTLFIQLVFLHRF